MTRNDEKKFNFTNAAISKLPLPEGVTRTGKLKEREYYSDLTMPGLQAVITRGGTITFNVFKWSHFEHKTIRLCLGHFPAINVEQARSLAHAPLFEIHKGENPAKAKRESRDKLTLGEAFDLYIEYLKDEDKKPRSIGNYNYYANHYAAELRQLPLSEITHERIIKLRCKVRNKDGVPTYTYTNGQKRKVYADRKTTANRVVSFISQTFNFLRNQRIYSGENPCKGIKKFEEPHRNRRLEDDELKGFIEACESLRRLGDTLVPDALLVCLFTGVRRRNVTSARWEDINLEAGIWNIPDTKNNLPHRVFLSSYILAILRERYQLRISDWVFPSQSEPGHLKEPLKGFLRVLRRGNIIRNGLVIHSLRHTFVTYAVEAKINQVVVSRITGHKLPGITAIYAHPSDKDVREGYETVSKYMLNLASYLPKIVALKLVG